MMITITFPHTSLYWGVQWKTSTAMIKVRHLAFALYLFVPRKRIQRSQYRKTETEGVLIIRQISIACELAVNLAVL